MKFYDITLALGHWLKQHNIDPEAVELRLVMPPGEANTVESQIKHEFDFRRADYVRGHGEIFKIAGISVRIEGR